MTCRLGYLLHTNKVETLVGVPEVVRLGQARPGEARILLFLSLYSE